MAREIKLKCYIRNKDTGIIRSYIWNVFANSDLGILASNEEVIEYGLQFTGLCDCNGKEIYEGDIIRLGKIKSLYDLQLFTIVFDCGSFRMKINIKGKPLLSFPYLILQMNQKRINPVKDISKYLEVIGNIYEHPELLNK